MGLLDKATTVTATTVVNTPAFETEVDTTSATGLVTTSPAVESVKPTVTSLTAAKTLTEVMALSPAQTGQLAPMKMTKTRKPLIAEEFEVLRDALFVEHDSLEQIICTNGNFFTRESKTNCGDSIVFELQSFQDSYVVSPNDDKAPIDVLRFSEDGITCTDDEQTPVKEHLAWLQENGYPKASLKQRAVVVALVEATAKEAGLTSELVQFDLPPSSRKMWERYLLTTSAKLRSKALTADKILRIKATANVTTNTEGQNYTQAKFEIA